MSDEFTSAGQLFDPNQPAGKVFEIRRRKRPPQFFNFSTRFEIPADGGRTDWPIFDYNRNASWGYQSALIRLSTPMVYAKLCSTAPPAVWNSGSVAIQGSKILYKQSTGDQFTPINTFEPGFSFIDDRTNNLTKYFHGFDFSGLQPMYVTNDLSASVSDPKYMANCEGYVSKGQDVTGHKSVGHNNTGYSVQAAWIEWPIEVYGFGFELRLKPIEDSGLVPTTQVLLIAIRCGMWVF